MADKAACPGHPLRAEIKPMQHFTVEASGERLQELEMENLEETSFWFQNKSFMMTITQPALCVYLAVLHCGRNVGHKTKVWVNRKFGNYKLLVNLTRRLETNIDKEVSLRIVSENSVTDPTITFYISTITFLQMSINKQGIRAGK